MSGPIMNFLAPASDRVVLSLEEENALLGIFAHAKSIIAVHASRLFKREFGPATQDEVTNFLAGEAGSASWSKRHARTFSQVIGKANPGSTGKKRAKCDAVKKYNARKAELRVAKDALMDVIMDKKVSAKLRDNAVNRMNILKRSERLVTPYAQAYRAYLNSTEARHSAKNNFWPTLARLVPKENGFVYTRRSGFTFRLNVLHVDLMNAINTAPSILSSLGKRRTGLEAVDDRLKQVLGRHLNGQISAQLHTVNLHIDTPPFGTLKKVKEHQRRDAAQLGRTGFSDSEKQRCFDWDVLFDVGPNNWSRLLREDRREKDTMCSFFLLRAATVVDELNKEWNRRAEEKGNTTRNLRVFLHGVCFAIHPSATTEKLHGCRLKRCGEGILVSTMTCLHAPDASQGESTRRIEEGLFIPYERSACFELVNGVLTRFPAGDSKHPETDTRLVLSHMAITKEHAPTHDSDCCGTYISSWDSDIPMIVLLSPATERDHIWIEIRDNVFDTFKMRLAIAAMGLSIEGLALIFALGGSDFTFGTFGVPQHRYLLAYIKRRTLPRPVLRLSLESPEEEFDTATMLAFLDIIESSEEATKASAFLYEKPEDIGSAEWRMKARIRIEKSELIRSADTVAPEAEDVFLQARRCKWLVRMWLRSTEWDCSGEAVQGCDIENGFDAISGAGVMEEPTAIDARKKEIALARQVFCKCKAGNGKCSGRCGCRRSGNMCVPGCGCRGICANEIDNNLEARDSVRMERNHSEQISSETTTRTHGVSAPEILSHAVQFGHDQNAEAGRIGTNCDSRETREYIHNSIPNVSEVLDTSGFETESDLDSDSEIDSSSDESDSS